MNRNALRGLIIASLEKQGFKITGDTLVSPNVSSKEVVRAMHGPAVQHAVDSARNSLEPMESKLLNRLASGYEVDPARIRPRLVPLRTRADDDKTFWYARLHWSIPTSRGYGRRVRFLVEDSSNGKLMGILGLGDPVYALPARDRWIGWSPEQRTKRLRYVMDAYVLGAVPPYSYLLGGKFIAMLAASNEVRAEYSRRYAGRKSVIRGDAYDGRLALVTTVSALGKSAVYDRLTFTGRKVFESAGFTQGWGEFQFADGAYDSIVKYASRWCTASDRHPKWGEGFRNRRELVVKCLDKVGIPREWRRHGVLREVFMVPLASNCAEFLRGDQQDLDNFDWTADTLFSHFRSRWLIPRSQRDRRWRNWNPESWRLWPKAAG
jgi:hypothetical protein